MQRISPGPGVSRLYEADLGKFCVKTGSRTKPTAPVPVKRGRTGAGPTPAEEVPKKLNQD